MKKLLMFAAIIAALVSCQSNNKKNAEAEMADSLAMIMNEPMIMEVDEVFTGTLPAADGPGINYVLTLGITTDGLPYHP